MKKVIFVFIILSLLLITSCNEDKPIDIIEPKLNEITFNKEYYYNGDKITFTVPDETDETYSLYYTSVDNPDGLKKVSDLEYIAGEPGKYTITIKNYDYPNWSYEKEIIIYSHLITLNATTYTLPISKQVEITINTFENMYEKSLDDFTFTSSDEEVASNNNNVFTALKPGKFNVIVQSKTNSNVKSSIEICVSNGNDFYIDPDIELGKIHQAEEMYFTLSSGTPSDYVWTTSDSEVVKIVKYDTKLKVVGVGEGVTNVSGYLISNPKIRTTYKITVEGFLEVDYIGRFIHTALDEVGVEEEGVNHQKYGVWYGNDGQPWCATFVSWCWYHAGLSNELLLKYQGCYTGYEWCLEKGIFHYKENYTPVTGDIIFFLSNGASHTGIVIYCDGTYVYTIEGNAADKVGIWRMGVNFNQITGYAHPKYPTYENVTPESFEWVTGVNPETKTYYWTHKKADDSTR